MIRTFRPGDEPAILAVVDAALPIDRPHYALPTGLLPPTDAS